MDPEAGCCSSLWKLFWWQVFVGFLFSRSLPALRRDFRGRDFPSSDGLPYYRDQEILRSSSDSYNEYRTQLQIMIGHGMKRRGPIMAIWPDQDLGKSSAWQRLLGIAVLMVLDSSLFYLLPCRASKRFKVYWCFECDDTGEFDWGASGSRPMQKLSKWEIPGWKQGLNLSKSLCLSSLMSWWTLSWQWYRGWPHLLIGAYLINDIAMPKDPTKLTIRFTDDYIFRYDWVFFAEISNMIYTSDLPSKLYPKRQQTDSERPLIFHLSQTELEKVNLFHSGLQVLYTSGWWNVRLIQTDSVNPLWSI